MNITERIFPSIISIFVAGLIYILKLNLYNLKDYKFVFSNTISVAAIMIGALITMVAILTAFTGKRVMKRIKEQKADNLLSNYFIYPILSGLIIALYSIILGIVLDESNSSKIPSQFFTIGWVFVSSYFILSTLRIFLIMLKLLNAVYVEDSQAKKERIEAKAEVSFDTIEDK